MVRTYNLIVASPLTLVVKFDILVWFVAICASLSLKASVKASLIVISAEPSNVAEPAKFSPLSPQDRGILFP